MSSPFPSPADARTKVARLSRYGAPDAAALSDARRDLAAAKIAAAIRKAVEAAPPLTPDQRAALAGLLDADGGR